MNKDQSHTSPDSRNVLVRDLVRRHQSRNLPVVRRTTGIDDLVKAMEWFRHSRILYVVDEDDMLLGVISLKSLVRHVFHHSHDCEVHPRDLMRILTTEGAEDLMSDFVCKAGMDERISHVLERMIDKGVEEIPVVDEEMKVISDVTMIDLLRAVTKEGRAES
jgi:CBS-domain-containing membrane protein